MKDHLIIQKLDKPTSHPSQNISFNTGCAVKHLELPHLCIHSHQTGLLVKRTHKLLGYRLLDQQQAVHAGHVIHGRFLSRYFLCRHLRLKGGNHHVNMRHFITHVMYFYHLNIKTAIIVSTEQMLFCFTSFQLGSEDGGGGGTMPMVETLKPMDWLRFPVTAAWPSSSAMFFSSVKSSSSENTQAAKMMINWTD